MVESSCSAMMFGRKVVDREFWEIGCMVQGSWFPVSMVHGSGWAWGISISISVYKRWLGVVCPDVQFHGSQPYPLYSPFGLSTHDIWSSVLYPRLIPGTLNHRATTVTHNLWQARICVDHTSHMLTNSSNDILLSWSLSCKCGCSHSLAINVFKQKCISHL